MIGSWHRRHFAVGSDLRETQHRFHPVTRSPFTSDTETIRSQLPIRLISKVTITCRSEPSEPRTAIRPLRARRRTSGSAVTTVLTARSPRARPPATGARVAWKISRLPHATFASLPTRWGVGRLMEFPVPASSLKWLPHFESRPAWSGPSWSTPRVNHRYRTRTCKDRTDDAREPHIVLRYNTRSTAQPIDGRP